ncbi:MAG: bifunctional phosphoribosylaminoimidazolecarboxamide formyltransferase/IMP cyclohydrolase, partial [Planctomycetota bacterium]|nr:bifunctional phosphoribosylaminoimidazolecarboxamide formyltransferase/IMP cyclohydrolase [Planctomycetota bacterium]
MQEKVRRALISVSDKSGVENFARQLAQMGVELLSTGGTFRLLTGAGVPVREVSDYTDFPEMMNGRIKTLHPKIHRGILARRDVEADLADMENHGIAPIDLLVVNLYPFEETIAQNGVSRAEAVEQIDIGGPTMVRAAAKNHAFVAVVTDTADYGVVLDELEKNDGVLGEGLRRRLAIKAFSLTARYDAAISAWLHGKEVAEETSGSRFPESAMLGGARVQELRYGENPHQAAALYATAGEREPSVVGAKILNGKALSYNNVVDLDAALALAKELEEPFACVIKHTNPCGAAIGATLGEAIEGAWAGDPLSAFGSVLAFNRPVDLPVAEFLTSERRFVEAIIAPAFEDDAFERLTQGAKWGRNVRLLACGPFGPDSRSETTFEVKRVVGGFLVQTRDLAAETGVECKVVSKTQPTHEQ